MQTFHSNFIDIGGIDDHHCLNILFTIHIYVLVYISVLPVHSVSEDPTSPYNV
jgi:hypothetical protein